MLPGIFLDDFSGHFFPQNEKKQCDDKICKNNKKTAAQKIKIREESVLRKTGSNNSQGFSALRELICEPPPGLLQESLGVSLEVSVGPFGPRSVQKVCPRSVRNTFLTLRRHSRDTFWTLQSQGPEGPQRHPEGHSRDTLGPKGPRDSCSRPGGS